VEPPLLAELPPVPMALSYKDPLPRLVFEFWIKLPVETGLHGSSHPAIE